MIPQPCRDLLALCLDVANKSESDVLACKHIDRAIGMLNYALTRGDITPIQHANEMRWVDLVQATRRDLADS